MGQKTSWFVFWCKDFNISVHWCEWMKRAESQKTTTFNTWCHSVSGTVDILRWVYVVQNWSKYAILQCWYISVTRVDELPITDKSRDIVYHFDIQKSCVRTAFPLKTIHWGDQSGLKKSALRTDNANTTNYDATQAYKKFNVTDTWSQPATL